MNPKPLPLFAIALAPLVLAACGEAPPEPRAAEVRAEPPAAPEAAPEQEPSGSRSAPAPDLLARRELSLGARPLALVAQDFDGDGYCDLAVATEKPGRLTVLSGGPEGLGDPGPHLDIGDFPTELCPQNGALYVGSKATGELLCLEVERTEAGLEPRILWRRTPGGTPRSLAAATLGDKHAVLWATRDDRVLVVEQDAVHGELKLETGARPVGILPLTEEPGFALLCQGTSDVRFFKFNPDGNAVLLGRTPMGGVPRSAAWADLDGDGDREAVFVGGDQRVLVFGLGGADLSAAPLETTQPGVVPAAVRAGDLDGDGRDELVSLGLIDQGYSVLGDFGPGGPGVRLSEYAGQDPWDLALGDFDGSGRLDLAVACRAAGALSLLTGTGIARPGKPAFYQATRLGVGGNPLSIAAVDLIGPSAGGTPDGHPEVATLDAADGMLSVLGNDGFGTLSLVRRLPAGAAARGLLALNTGAGQQVLTALSVPAGGAARLLAFGAVDGEPSLLEAQVAVPLPASTEAQIAGGDLDGDGRDELVFADPLSAALVILQGRGRSGLAVEFEARAAVELPGIASALAILRQPGGPLIAAAIDGQLWLLDLDGDPVRQLTTPARARQGRGCGRIIAADLNGDGHDDVASLWLGPQGTSPGLLATELVGASFQITFELPTGLAPADLLAADLNGDGLDELFVAAQNSHLVNLWVNHGGGGGLAMAPDIGVGLGPLDLCAADLVGKGLPDLIVANAFSADVSIVYDRPR